MALLNWRYEGQSKRYVNGKINDVSIDDKVVGDATIDASEANRKFKITTLKLPVGEASLLWGYFGSRWSS